MAFSTYRDSIRASLIHWPELTWLNRFLQTSKPDDGDKTFAHVFELIDNRFVGSEAQTNATSFAQAIEANVPGSRLRLVLICHGQSWDVDRDIVDVVCSKYDIDPRFVAKHFDHPAIRYERHCPRDLRRALNEVDEDFFQSEYTWDLGGDVMSPLSFQLGSCYYFAYEKECLSLAIHPEKPRRTGKQTVSKMLQSILIAFEALLFLRTSSDQPMDTSRIFFSRQGLAVTGSTLLTTRISRSLAQELVHAISKQDIPQEATEYFVIGQLALSYITNLAGCCTASYRRELAPRAFRNHDFNRTNSDKIHDEIRHLRDLRYETESFLKQISYDQNEKLPKNDRNREICRLLLDLEECLKDLLSLYLAKGRETQSEYLGKLSQAQIDQAKEAKETSKSLGYLSRLAYMSLPLQLTTSAMGMNLKVFGTGNVELKTVIFMLSMLASLSFVLVLLPLIFSARFKRLSQIGEASRYSKRAALLFAWFCLFHGKTVNDKVWESGMSYDINFFKGQISTSRTVNAEGWASHRNRKRDELRSIFIPVFPPSYWKGVLDELINTIDSPRWRRRSEDDHAE
ncbi:MAG: hypothetical protein Q9160_005235 [Pyrenula sp. 1 TL-2023]